MKFYLYLLAGISSALLGWNIGQFFLTDLGVFPQYPEITLFPCIAVSLACSMVMNEIFISNPTRPKRSFQTAQRPLLIATGLGIISGLVAGIISQILFLPIYSCTYSNCQNFGMVVNWCFCGFGGRFDLALV